MTLDTTTKDQKPPQDTKSCDQEAIHLLNRVQSYAGVLVLNINWQVQQVSSNIQQFLNQTPEQLLGLSFKEMLSSDILHKLRGALNKAMITERAEPIFNFSLLDSAPNLDISIHQCLGLIIIELETASQQTFEPSELLFNITSILKQALDFDDLTNTVVEQFRISLDFDRVMLYKFLPDYSGEVIAESLIADCESYLGLRFPASDIPAQARALYQQQVFRAIMNVHDTNATFIPNTPLDFSRGLSRGVSALHIEYLINMGVESSLSISIVVNNKLWGLISCHHFQPKYLDLRTRNTCILLAEYIALEFQLRLNQAQQQLALQAEMTAQDIIKDLKPPQPISNLIDLHHPKLKTMVDCHGLALVSQNQVYTHGSTPSEEAIAQLAVHYFDHMEGKVVHFDIEPDQDHQSTGVLCIEIAKRPNEYLLFFRDAMTQSVTWAGHPDKAIGKDGRLSPRKSFQAWVETHNRSCKPWSDQDIFVAHRLHSSLLEIVMTQMDSHQQLMQQKYDQYQLLVSELNHRVRNILHLVEAVISQSLKSGQSTSEYSEDILSRVVSLASSHDLLTAKLWEPVQLLDIIQTEINSYLQVERKSVDIRGPNVSILPGSVTPIVLTLHEMLTNAVKYGAFAYSNLPCALHIYWYKQDDDSLQIIWHEENGRNQPIEMGNKGFGTSLIEAAIPHELGGRVEYSVDNSLTITILIPAAHLSWHANQHPSTPSSDQFKPQPVTTDKTNLSNDQDITTILVVEDSLLIALDIRKKILSLGFDKVDIISNHMQAMKYLKHTRPYHTFLDFHLGQENSTPIAEELLFHKLPFSFITGFGNALKLSKALENHPIEVLQKPCQLQDLATILQHKNDASRGLHIQNQRNTRNQ